MTDKKPMNSNQYDHLHAFGQRMLKRLTGLSAGAISFIILFGTLAGLAAYADSGPTKCEKKHKEFTLVGPNDYKPRDYAFMYMELCERQGDEKRAATFRNWLNETRP